VRKSRTAKSQRHQDFSGRATNETPVSSTKAPQEYLGKEVEPLGLSARHLGGDTRFG
jgi:hypothetical protein